MRGVPALADRGTVFVMKKKGVTSSGVSGREVGGACLRANDSLVAISPLVENPYILSTSLH
jgi:hypothetical protein